MACIEDFEEHAFSILDKNARDYYKSGADKEQTLKDNVEAFRRYRLRPHMLRGAAQPCTTVKLLGNEISSPICVSPTAFQCMAHHEGESGTAKACVKMQTCMVLSSWSTTHMRDVALAGRGGTQWFQLYIYKDRQLTQELVMRAENEGFKAIVLTVDTPVLGKRLADCRNQFCLPKHLTLANFSSPMQGSTLINAQEESGLQQYVSALICPNLSWASVDWLRSITNLPIVLKGILTAEDALEALNHDIQGILVSNHGARQLDGVLATVDALPEVVQAVAGRVEVYMDGGIRHGTDVLKALALGARAVFIGRPVLWGLAYKGSEGVEQVLKLLNEELKVAMTLSGCSDVSDITGNLVVHQSHVSGRHAARAHL